MVIYQTNLRVYFYVGQIQRVLRVIVLFPPPSAIMYVVLSRYPIPERVNSTSSPERRVVQNIKIKAKGNYYNCRLENGIYEKPKFTFLRVIR